MRRELHRPGQLGRPAGAAGPCSYNSFRGAQRQAASARRPLARRFVLGKLPPASVLIPPTPPLQRFKREVSVMVEQSEVSRGLVWLMALAAQVARRL